MVMARCFDNFLRFGHFDYRDSFPFDSFPFLASYIANRQLTLLPICLFYHSSLNNQSKPALQA
jgi:hypothetical protein